MNDYTYTESKVARFAVYSEGAFIKFVEMPVNQFDEIMALFEEFPETILDEVVFS